MFALLFTYFKGYFFFFIIRVLVYRMTLSKQPESMSVKSMQKLFPITFLFQCQVHLRTSKL